MIYPKHRVLVFMGATILATVWILRASDAQTSADPEVNSALKQVQEMLMNPQLRQQETQKTPEGRAAAQKVENLGGSAQTNEDIYALASDIFAQMVQETGGDIQKLKAKVADAQKNPEAFASSWNAQNQGRLRKISTQMPMN